MSASFETTKNTVQQALSKIGSDKTPREDAKTGLAGGREDPHIRASPKNCPKNCSEFSPNQDSAKKLTESEKSAPTISSGWP
jgi:hypothetical protein